MLYQPDEPEIPTGLAHQVSGTDPIKELNLPLFTIQTVPGKGNGLITRTNIAKGTRILSEKPLFTTANLSPISLMESTIATQLKSLPKPPATPVPLPPQQLPRQAPIQRLSPKPTLSPCAPTSNIGAIYPNNICLLNHSLSPKRPQQLEQHRHARETIHAMRAIDARDEITHRLRHRPPPPPSDAPIWKTHSASSALAPSAPSPLPRWQPATPAASRSSVSTPRSAIPPAS